MALYIYSKRKIRCGHPFPNIHGYLLHARLSASFQRLQNDQRKGGGHLKEIRMGCCKYKRVPKNVPFLYYSYFRGTLKAGPIRPAIGCILIEKALNFHSCLDLQHKLCL